MSTISVRCLCGASVRVDTGNRQPHLDRRAVAARLVAVERGWAYRGQRIGKTTITMTCWDCRKKVAPLVLEADFLPEDVVPGTLEEDES